MANKRVYYATKGLAIKKSGTANNRDVLPLSASGWNPDEKWQVPRGVQSCTVDTAIQLEDVFQQGQLALYEQMLERPEISVSVNRVLDGTKPLFLMATSNRQTEEGWAGLPSGQGVEIPLEQRVKDYAVDLALLIYPEDNAHASGSNSRPAVGRILCSGMYPQSVTYTFPIDGPSTEEVNFIGNNKFWNSDTLWGVAGSGTAGSGSFPWEDLINTDEDATAVAIATSGHSSGVTRREHFRLPGEGTAAFPLSLPVADRQAIQNVTVSCDLGQEEVMALGRRDAYCRYVTFPVTVNCSFEVVTSIGDMKEAHATSTVADETIIIETDQGLKLNLGTRNKLENISYNGGDTGGGNVSVTYSYRNSNDLTVSAYGWV